MQTLILSLIVSLVLALVFGYFLIPVLRKLKFGQQVRDDGPSSHLTKSGTPSMGGLIFIIPLFVVTLIFTKGDFANTIYMLAITLGFAAIGFIDDYIKIKKKRSLGLKAYQKIIGQLGLASVATIHAYLDPNIGSEIYIPFFNIMLDVGIWFIPLTIFIFVAMVNAVNLTDGLDGLAGGVTFINAATYSLIFFIMFTAATNNGLITLANEYYNAMVFACALAGSLLGFLKYNAHPAKVFMGDTGSLALGAALAVVGTLTEFQMLLPVMGIMFVVSAVSVILQVGSFKLRKGKRIFKMAPLHHHFELKGVHETKIVMAYLLITIVMCTLVVIFLIN